MANSEDAPGASFDQFTEGSHVTFDFERRVQGRIVTFEVGGNVVDIDHKAGIMNLEVTGGRRYKEKDWKEIIGDARELLSVQRSEVKNPRINRSGHRK